MKVMNVLMEGDTFAVVRGSFRRCDEEKGENLWCLSIKALDFFNEK